jgi:hypothetical protein
MAAIHVAGSTERDETCISAFGEVVLPPTGMARMAQAASSRDVSCDTPWPPFISSQAPRTSR